MTALMDGSQLRARRSGLALSRGALGRLLGVAENTIYRWEAGRLPIASPEMLDLALWALERQALDGGDASHVWVRQESFAGRV